MNWYLSDLRNYAVFDGRARRKEYWFYVLFTFVACLLLAAPGGIPAALYWLATLVPTFAVTVRRLHDTGRSGWWYLLILIPLVGGIVLLVFWLQRGTQGRNRYGDDPVAAPEPPGWKDFGWSEIKAAFGGKPQAQGDTLSQLERLNKLREQCALSEDEFQAQKAKILKS
jgi:uncharacterized membrane protein YhaH (DUF805 family)